MAPAFAHHSGANFLNETIVLQGEVVRFRWVNPHAYFYVRVIDAGGKAVEWTIEASATPTLARSGWTKDSLRAGEHVTVRARPDRNRTRPFALVQSILKDDGTVLSIRRPESKPDGPAQRAQTIFGTWQPAHRREGGQGIAPGPADEPPLALPLTPKGLEAARNFDVSTNPRLKCIPLTSPENLGNPYLHTIERRGDNVLLRNEYMETERIVYMDGRPAPQGKRAPQGHSVGRWEADVLVVETTNFTNDAWGTARGIPSGARKRVSERYRLTDGGETLTVEFTIDEPDYLIRPFSSSAQWRYAPQLTLVPNKCDSSVARVYLGSD